MQKDSWMSMQQLKWLEMRRIDYKVPEGKLLRIEADIDNNTIKNIKIHGDFFIHPETGLIEIENSLKGSTIDDKLEDRLTILTKDMKMIGVCAKDIVHVLKKFIKQ